MVLHTHRGTQSHIDTRALLGITTVRHYWCLKRPRENWCIPTHCLLPLYRSIDESVSVTERLNWYVAQEIKLPRSPFFCITPLLFGPFSSPSGLILNVDSALTCTIVPLVLTTHPHVPPSSRLIHGDLCGFVFQKYRLSKRSYFCRSLEM